MRKRLHSLACCLALAAAATAAPAEPAQKPPTVALLAAVGDQIDVVRQRERTGSHREPFTRRRFALDGRALNLAVLNGLDRAIGEEEPDAQRVLLAWTAPADLQERLAGASGADRETLLLQALQAHLATVPARAGWDRIELILPAYLYSDVRGMGRKLAGLGFYVQPLGRGALPLSWDAESAPGGGMAPDADRVAGSDHRTVDPHTGAVGRSSTYVATYMYFQRITLDARTLAVTGRKRQLDNVKYADPRSTALDVGDQIPLQVMTGKLLELAERSAYTSVRGKSSVSVTAPRVVEPPASAVR